MHGCRHQYRVVQKVVIRLQLAQKVISHSSSSIQFIRFSSVATPASDLRSDHRQDHLHAPRLRGLPRMSPVQDDRVCDVGQPMAVSHPEPEVVVFCARKSSAHTAKLQIRCSSHQGRWRRYWVRVYQQPTDASIVDGIAHKHNWPELRISCHDRAPHQRHVWLMIEDRHLAGEPVRHCNIVGIQPGQIFATRAPTAEVEGLDGSSMAAAMQLDSIISRGDGLDDVNAPIA
jgi:hypothetical protein